MSTGSHFDTSQRLCAVIQGFSLALCGARIRLLVNIQIIMKRLLSVTAGALVLGWLAASQALAWDYEGHRIVNQLALASLPTNFPAFVRQPATAERIAFLAGEPDRWRNTPDLPLKHFNGPDHYIDLEQLTEYGLKPESLPPLRYDFIAALGVARKMHPENFPAIDASRNEDHTRELVGLLPWALAENYSKLKSGFSYLKAFEENGGTPEEIANAQQNIVYIMGVMGHYAGDSSQPLHSTIHHHGWVGQNPNHYTTESSIHSWIDGGFFRKIGGANLKELSSKVRTAQLLTLNQHPAEPSQVFQAGLEFIREQHRQVEPLYELYKDGKLSGEGEKGTEGRAFLEAQLLKAGQFLGDIWYSAWQQAPADSYLKSQLAHRSQGK
jgi:hypothetical protein